MMKMLFEQKGFTLVEILAAIMVFAFGMLALYRLQAATLVSGSFSNEISQAAALGQDRMEVLMSRPYDRAVIDPLLLDGDGDGTGQDTNEDGQDDIAANGTEFGLDDEGAAAEGCITIDARTNVVTNNCSAALRAGIDYRISHNIAVDQHYVGTRTIRVVVRWSGIQDKGSAATHSVSLTSVKAIGR
jgi:prepilin-type N-terminal cleavage/methylation domain-containing protein